MEYVQTKQLGKAKVTIINVGDSQGSLADMFKLPEEKWPEEFFCVFAEPQKLPVQSVLIELPNVCALVDACDAIPPNSPYAIPDYVPPPPLLEQLSQLGIAPSKIDHLIVTHAHFDHVAGAITLQDGNHVPSYPKADYHVGRADRESYEIDEHLQQALPELNIFETLQQHGQLKLIDGAQDLGHGITIIPTPGETPGHQMVRIHSEGKTLYCVGDLIHHPLELELPELCAWWADRDAMLTSRQQLLSSALKEDALLVVTHVQGFGKVRQADSTLTWERA